MITRLFYLLIGSTAVLALFIVFYWSLRLTSSIGMLKDMTAPAYFWLYVLFTLGTVVLFGVNASLIVYQWRRLGTPKFGGQAGTGFGALIGLGASACPVCGAVILSAIGVVGGLTAFPFQGLELKAISFGLMALPVWLIARDLRRTRCVGKDCPALRDPSFKASDRWWLAILSTLFVVLAAVSATMLNAESG